ncbi:MAG: glycosyltransferase family 4 protein [Sedimentisphaerales bacterium]|nr:glycosyltransferase family 4 protein [Sedimentisphaerales bacterium]
MKKTKSRVLYVHSSSDLWGSDRCLYHMLEMIDRDKYEPFVVLPWPGPLSARVEALGVEIVYPPCMSIIRRFRNPLGYVAYFCKLAVEVVWLAVMLRKRRVDLVHVNTSSLIGPLVAARLCRIPVLCHVREIRTRPRLVGLALAATINLLADHVIAISSAVARHMRAAWLKPHSLEIIHDGLDLARCDAPVDSHALLGDIPADRPVVSMIGRITHLKGAHVFVDAARQVLRSLPDTYFLIVGASDTEQARQYEQRLRQEVQTSGLYRRVWFTGFIADLHAILSRTDVLVLPSVYPEGFGMVAIEAMSAGKPVIATRHGGPLDIIREGREGFLVTPDDPRELAQKIVLLVANAQLRTEMGARARRRVARRFHICETMTSIHKTYEKVVI